MGSAIDFGGDMLDVKLNQGYTMNRNIKLCNFRDEIMEQIERLNRYQIEECVNHKKCCLGKDYYQIIDSKSSYSGSSRSSRYGCLLFESLVKNFCISVSSYIFLVVMIISISFILVALNANRCFLEQVFDHHHKSGLSFRCKRFFSGIWENEIV